MLPAGLVNCTGFLAGILALPATVAIWDCTVDGRYFSERTNIRFDHSLFREFCCRLIGLLPKAVFKTMFGMHFL